MCNTCNFFKIVEKVQNFAYFKKTSAKYIKLCLNVLKVPNCVRCAKFGRYFRIVRKLFKLENTCKIVQQVQISFFHK